MNKLLKLFPIAIIAPMLALTFTSAVVTPKAEGHFKYINNSITFNGKTYSTDNFNSHNQRILKISSVEIIIDKPTKDFVFYTINGVDYLYVEKQNTLINLSTSTKDSYVIYGGKLKVFNILGG